MQSHSCCLCSEFSIASTASSSSGSTYEALTQQKPKHGIYFKYVRNYCADSGLLGCLLTRHVCLKTKNNLEEVSRSMHYVASSVQTTAKFQCWGGWQVLRACFHWEQRHEERMHLEDHHDIPRDCMDLGGAPGSYLDFIYLDYIWAYFI